jgi:hypothetical protein
MKALLLIASTCVFPFLFDHAQAAEDSFLLYAWACPDEESYRESRQAFVNLDQDAFEATDCVSLRPGTKYRLLRCDPDILDEFLDRFEYEIERSEEVTSLQCEISVTNEDGVSSTYFVSFSHLALLEPRPN